MKHIYHTFTFTTLKMLHEKHGKHENGAGLSFCLCGRELYFLTRKLFPGYLRKKNYDGV